VTISTAAATGRPQSLRLISDSGAARALGPAATPKVRSGLPARIHNEVGAGGSVTPVDRGNALTNQVPGRRPKGLGAGVLPRLDCRQINLEEAVMGSAAVPGQLWGADSYDGAEVAATLARLSCDVGADVVRAGGDVMPASGFERWGLRGGGGGNSGIVSRFGFTLYPVPTILGGLRNQHVRPAQ